MLLAAAAIFLLTWLPIIIWPGKVPLILLCAVLFVMGLAASSANLALVMVKEALPSSIAGTAVGSANVMNMLGAAAMPSVAAWLISYLGSTERAPEVVYRYSLLPCLVLALIAFVAVVLVGRGGGLRVYRGGTQARQESGRP